MDRAGGLGMASDPFGLVDRPTDTDVVLGRGNAQAWRPGNTTFHKMLDEQAPIYHASTTTKKAKGEIIQEIYRRITSSGRFLIRHGSTDQYQVVQESDAKVRDFGFLQ